MNGISVSHVVLPAPLYIVLAKVFKAMAFFELGKLLKVCTMSVATCSVCEATCLQLMNPMVIVYLQH